MRLLIANILAQPMEEFAHRRISITVDLKLKPTCQSRIAYHGMPVKSHNEPFLKSVTAIATRDVNVSKFAPVNNNLWSLKPWVGQRRLSS